MGTIAGLRLLEWESLGVTQPMNLLISKIKHRPTLQNVFFGRPLGGGKVRNNRVFVCGDMMNFFGTSLVDLDLLLPMLLLSTI